MHIESYLIGELYIYSSNHKILGVNVLKDLIVCRPCIDKPQYPFLVILIYLNNI